MDWEAFYSHFREKDFVPGYEIQNRLGGGAFGEVYKARKHSIGKPYAIKFLKIDDDEQRGAVERELEQVRHFAAIDHPNLVTIEDLGTVMDVPYLIMGYAGEETLARALRQHKLEPESALRYFVQACRGVLALHDRRLVHFDLKPSNIFIKGEIARVGDYGLSKMMVDGRSTLSFGRGTPHYMAPEMLRNRADHRADLYSLGVILYESICGKLPFESSVPGTLAVREDDAPPQFPSAFPVLLRAVVERALRLDPDDRYASVGELLEDLGQTARPGDSVRIDWNRVPPPRAARARPPRATKAGTAADGPSSAHSEARQTAAEFARGAVEVARGVWDGLRNASTTPAGAREASTPTRPLPPTPPMPAPAPRVDAAEQRAPSVTQAQPAEHPPSVPLRSGGALDADEGVIIHSLSEGRNAPPPAPRPEIAARRWQPASPAGTIPVPPQVEGGVPGTIMATVVLALEVFFTLLRGLARRLARFVGMRFAARSALPAVDGPSLLIERVDVEREPSTVAARGFLARLRRLFVRVLRLALFVVFMLVLGGLVTVGAILLFKGTS